MNTTQYFRHENFLVIQNGDYNDTFEISNHFDYIGYLESQNYSETAKNRVGLLLDNWFGVNDKESFYIDKYDFPKCIIPNPKVTIEFNHDYVKDLQGRFAFYLNGRFVFTIYSKEYQFLSDIEGKLTKNQYCEILFVTASKETRNSLNQIINSLNTLAKYDAN